jgi:photosystem II stability/assembly factor-like uncharacterized protein
VNTLIKTLIVFLFVLFWVSDFIYAQQRLYDDLFSVSFPTENNGWTCGRWGTILHTKDGGKTWDHQDSKVNYTLSAIFFVDPQHGWAVGDEGTIICTKNGGKTWEKQRSPVSFRLMDLYFIDTFKGWIVTEQTHVLYTDDGGKTWIIQFKDKDFILKAISFCDPIHGWAVGEYGYIYYTDNGGVTWQNQAGFFDLSEDTGDLVGGTFLFDVVAFDPDTAWAVGIDGYVINTEDGGKTWKEVETGVARTQLFCISTDKTDRILIGGKGVLLSSFNKGHKWQSLALKPPITYGWIYGLAPRASSKFIAVGWEGAIYLSASNTWHRVNY